MRCPHCRRSVGDFGVHWQISSKASFVLTAAQTEMCSFDVRIQELGTATISQCVQATCNALGVMGADLGDHHMGDYQ